ncbi:hypothetical protein PENSUB_5645 [Penicillium subrubescens]|uniref:Uncharacterized protein n=1 Tax=Penicillium subrubescens TaxID=1316194 RepID=A0A1Q5U787_9EURO|nr:hypothetical protein PENSUB_5645 [Penicillium subrubescens]
MQGLIKAIRMVVDTGKIARWDSEDFEIGATGVKMQRSMVVGNDILEIRRVEPNRREKDQVA